MSFMRVEWQLWTPFNFDEWKNVLHLLRMLNSMSLPVSNFINCLHYTFNIIFGSTPCFGSHWSRHFELFLFCIVVAVRSMFLIHRMNFAGNFPLCELEIIISFEILIVCRPKLDCINHTYTCTLIFFSLAAKKKKIETLHHFNGG